MNISDELEKILNDMDEDEKRKLEESNTAKSMALLADGGTPTGVSKKAPASNDLIHELRAQMYGADPANTNMPMQQDFATQLMQYLAQMYFPGLVQQGQANVPTAAQGNYADVPSHANGGSVGYHQPGSLEQNMLALGGHRALPIIMALHKAAGGSVDLPKFKGGGDLGVSESVAQSAGIPQDYFGSDQSEPSPYPYVSYSNTTVPNGPAPDRAGVQSLDPISVRVQKPSFLQNLGEDILGAADVGKTLMLGTAGMIPGTAEFMAKALEKALTGDNSKSAQDLYAESLSHYTPDLLTERGKEMGGDLMSFMERNKIPLAIPELMPFEEALGSGAGAAMRKSDEALKSLEPPPGTLAMNVYHGTPHKFEKFDASKIGTGEGNQARGYGLYLAESPKTAEFYKDTLTPSQEFVNNEPINYDNPMHILAARLRDNGGDLAETREALEGLATPLQGKSKRTVDLGKEALRLFDNGKRPVLKTVKSEGNFYHVDLPDEHIENMLDWDKPIKEQSELVKSVANSLLPKIKQTSPDFDLNKVTGEGLYRSYQQYRGNHPEFASEGLKENGIFGIKYLDQDSRHAGEGTRNFVVFPGEEDKLKILSRNGEPVNPTELTPEQRLANFENYIKDAQIKDRLYHGTTHDFREFDPKKSMGDLGVSWLSSDPNFASGYDYTQNTGHVMPVHTNVKNIFDFDNPEHLNKLKEAAKDVEIYDPVRGFTTLDKFVPENGQYYSAEHPGLFRLIKDMGHDAVAVTERGVKNYGIFNPKTIKSAIANKGTYDTTKRDITKAQGGAV